MVLGLTGRSYVLDLAVSERRALPTRRAPYDLAFALSCEYPLIQGQNEFSRNGVNGCGSAWGAIFGLY